LSGELPDDVSDPLAGDRVARVLSARLFSVEMRRRRGVRPA